MHSRTCHQRAPTHSTLDKHPQSCVCVLPSTSMPHQVGARQGGWPWWFFCVHAHTQRKCVCVQGSSAWPLHDDRHRKGPLSRGKVGVPAQTRLPKCGPSTQSWALLTTNRHLDHTQGAVHRANQSASSWSTQQLAGRIAGVQSYLHDAGKG